MFGIITGGVLSVCNFVVKMSPRKKRKEKKKKKKYRTCIISPVSYCGLAVMRLLIFLYIDSVKEQTCYCWFPKTCLVFLDTPPVFICLISFFTERESVY